MTTFVAPSAHIQSPGSTTTARTAASATATAKPVDAVPGHQARGLPQSVQDASLLYATAVRAERMTNLGKKK